MGVLDLEKDWSGKSISYWQACATVKNELFCNRSG